MGLFCLPLKERHNQHTGITTVQGVKGESQCVAFSLRSQGQNGGKDVPPRAQELAFNSGLVMYLKSGEIPNKPKS